MAPLFSVITAPVRMPLEAKCGSTCQEAAVPDVATSILLATGVPVTLVPLTLATVGFGYVPDRSPPAAPEVVGVCHVALVPLVAVSTWPVVGVAGTLVPLTLATVGAVAVPARSPAS